MPALYLKEIKAMATLKVHMIGNAHLDPVWLWNWQAGVDEALAAAFSAANLLDEYDQFVFTRSDMWFHRIVEDLNPELFERVRRHVASGRWQIVGGWYIQPDCNLPTEQAFRKHIELGLRDAREKFGVDVTIGYNVDSFGHAGSLPRILAENGYDSYVFMRPMKHEKELPSNIFRWRAAGSDHELMAYRIPVAYTSPAPDLREHILKTVEEVDPSMEHVMCFYGVGDHGGGPTRRQIEYILEHQTAFDGLELVFSHPRAFFDAIKSQREKLPVVEGELQMHAVGCYTSLRRLKAEIRTAEHKLIAAEKTVEKLPDCADPDAAAKIDKAWEDVLFNQFHDTYGGTCLKSAYPDIFDQIGRARAVADALVVSATRRLSTKQPPVALSDDALAYAAVFNHHDKPYRGYLEHEFFGMTGRKAHLVDAETNEPLATQILPAESKSSTSLRVLCPIELAAGQTKLLRLSPDGHAVRKSDIRAKRSGITNTHWRVECDEKGLTLTDVASGKITTVAVQVLEDLSDTWSHDVVRFQGRPLGPFKRKRVLLEEAGPVRASLAWIGQFKNSRMRLRARLYAGDPFVELVLDLFWGQQKTLAKMIVEPAGPIAERIDGIPGGRQDRPLSGAEFPLHDWTRLRSADGTDLGLIAPEVYAIDVDQQEARLTLIRSPRYALHMDDVPEKQDPAQFPNDFLDQGEHRYRFLLRTGQNIDLEQLARIALQIQQPPVHWDPPYRRNWP